MPDKDYNKAVYGKLKATYGDKLTISEDDFIKKLSSDEAYAKAAYGKLKDIYKDAFKAEEKDFLQEVKKKDNSQSNGGGTENGTKQPLQQPKQSVSPQTTVATDNAMGEVFSGVNKAKVKAQEQIDLEAKITAPQTAPQKTAYNPMDIDSVNKKYGQLGGINKSVGDMAEPLPKSLQTTPIEDKIKIEKQKIVDKAIEKGITTEQYKEQNFDKAAAKYVPPYIKDEYETYKQIEKIKKDYAAYKAQGNEFQAEVSKTKLEAANQKLAIKKANTDRNIDSRISEINTLISEIKQGSNPGKFQDIEKLEQEAEDLKLQKQAFFNPLQATKSKIAEYGVKVDSWEQIKDYYAAIQSEYEDLLEKNPIAVGTVGRYTGEAERFVDLYNQVRTLAPIVLANRTPSNKDDSARSVFAKTAIQTAIPTTKGALQTQKQVADMINTSMEVAKINPSDINLPVAEALKKQATYENFSSKDWASMTGLTVGMMPHFALGGKVVGGLGKALNAEKALAQIVKNPKAYKWTKYVAGAVGTGLEYKAAGVLSPHLGDEATFASGFLGSALSKPAEKLFNAIGAKNVVQKVFKENAQGAVDIIEKVGKLVAKGTGETLEEYGNEFGNLFAKYAETRDAQQLVKEIDERFGTVSKNFHFAVMSFVMGAGMGVGNAFGSYSTNEAKKAYNNLSEEEKGKFDEFVKEANQEVKKAKTDAVTRDAEIKEARAQREKMGVTSDNEIFSDVPETVTKTMDRFDEKLPLDKTAVEEASSYLYDKYKELERMKSIEEGRTMTTEEIEAIQSDLETDITNLETYLATGEYAKPKVEETPIIEQPEVEEVVAEETTVKEEITVKEEPKPTPQKIKVLGKDVNMYNDYIPSKVEDVETDAMYSFNADSKDGIPTLLHDKAYTNTREVNGVKTENWHASISGEELLKLYPKEQSLKETPKAGSVGVGGDVEIKNEGKAEAPTKESVTERLNINNPFYRKVEDALVKLGLIEKYNPETGTGDVVGGYAQQTSDGGFSVGKMLFSQDGSISYFDGDVKVSFDKNGNVISENTKEVKAQETQNTIKSLKESIISFENLRDSEAFKYKEITQISPLGDKTKIKVLKTEQELKASTDKINAQIDKSKAELRALEQTTNQPESNPTLKDVESTAKALEGVEKSNKSLWDKIKDIVNKISQKLGGISDSQHINDFNKAKTEWSKLSRKEKQLKRADYELDGLPPSQGGYYKVGDVLFDLDLSENIFSLLISGKKLLSILPKLGVTTFNAENRPAEEMFGHYSDGKIHLNNNSAYENIRQLTRVVTHELGHHEFTKLSEKEKDYVNSLSIKTGMALQYKAQGDGKQTSASLEEENFADYVMQYFQGKLYGDETLLNSIPERLSNIFDDKYSNLLNENNEISTAYHKAKADGSNPELVKGLESLLSSKEEAPKIEPPKFATEAKAEKRNIAFPSFIPTEQSTKKTDNERNETKPKSKNDDPSIEKPIRSQKKISRTRQDRDPEIIKALSEEPNDIEDIVLQSFISQNSFLTKKAIESVLKGRGEQNVRLQLSRSEKNGGKTINQIAHDIWTGLSDEQQETYDTEAVKNAVESVVIGNVSRKGMATKFNQKRNASDITETDGKFFNSNGEELFETPYGMLSQEQIDDYLISQYANENENETDEIILDDVFDLYDSLTDEELEEIANNKDKAFEVTENFLDLQKPEEIVSDKQKPKKSLRLKIKDKRTEASKKAAETDQELQAALRDLFDNTLNSGFNPEKATKALKLMYRFVELGVYKFEDIILTLSEKIPLEDIEAMWEYLLDAYAGAHRRFKDKRELMSDLLEVESLTIDDFIERPTFEIDAKEVFIGEIKKAIVAKKKLNYPQMRKLAEDAGIIDESIVNPDKLLQELAEFAIIGLAEKINDSDLPTQTKIDQIEELYQYQPSFTMRSSERVMLGQFSTPVTISFAAGEWVNAFNPNTGLEPSAGNGMMLSNVKNRKNFLVNEIDSDRSENLRKRYDNVSDIDGGEISSIANNVDALVMNPPFGNSKKVTIPGMEIDAGIVTIKNIQITGLDKTHVIEALKTLSPNGAASIVINGHNEYRADGRIESPNDWHFMTYLYRYFNVVDVINIDEKMYSKQGTTVPVRLILIKGRRSPDNKLAPKKDDSNNEIISETSTLINRINEKIALQQKIDANQANSSNTNGNGRNTNRSDTRNDGNRQGGDTGKTTREVDENDEGVQPIGQQPKDVNKGESGSVGDRGKRTGGSGQSSIDFGTNDPNTGSVQPTDTKPRADDERGSDEFIPRVESPTSLSRISNRSIDIEKTKQPYISNSKVPYEIGSVIPTGMAQSTDAILSSFKDIDAFVSDRLGWTQKQLGERLSKEQVDSVALAIYNIEQSESLVIGDMTGIGKGRSAAAIITYAIKQGIKPVFVTQSSKLFTDIYRDLKGIGSENYVPFIVNNHDGARPAHMYEVDINDKKTIMHSANIPDKAERLANNDLDGYDYVVTTYSQFNTERGTINWNKPFRDGNFNITSSKDGGIVLKENPTTGEVTISINGSVVAGHKNMQKAKSAAREFSPSSKRGFLSNVANGGILVMDESHLSAGTGQTNAYFLSVLRQAKGAVFLSATSMKTPQSIIIYAMKNAIGRLNFGNMADTQNVIESIMRGGVAMQEIVSSGLTEIGQMIRRERDMSDRPLTFEPIKEDKEYTKEKFNEVNEAFNLINEVSNLVKDIEVPAIKDSGADVETGDPLSVSYTPFASKMFVMINQLLLSLKADAVANEAINEIKNGRKPIISVNFTNESMFDEFDEGMGEVISKPDFSWILKRALRNTLKLRVGSGNNKETVMLDFNDLSETTKAAYLVAEAYMESISTDLHISPIDVIKNTIIEKGYTIGELTGRSKALDKDNRMVQRKRDDLKTMSGFQNGNIDALIINRSASTGVSLHADKNAKDQKQRVLLIVQAQLDINQEIQVHGRNDRTGQTKRGAVRYLYLSVPAEQRLFMMLQSKLKSLLASTTSSGESDIDAPDMINKYGDIVATESMMENPTWAELLQDPLRTLGADPNQDEQEVEVNAMDSVLKKMPFAKIEIQEQIFNDLTERYKTLIDHLNENGENDLTMQSLPLNAQVIDSVTSVEGKDKNNPFGSDTNLEVLMVDSIKKPMTQSEIDKEISNLSTETSTLEEDAAKHSKEKLDNRIDTIKNVAKRKLEKAEATLNKQLEKATITEEQKDTKLFEEKQAIDLEQESDIEVAKDIENFNLSSKIGKRVREFKPGSKYEVPIDFNDATKRRVAIFLGFKYKVAIPSQIVAVFATSDGRRQVTIPLSQSAKLDSIQRSLDNENWDTLISRVKNRHGVVMVTGNMMKVFEAYKGRHGKFVSYTNQDGSIKNGYLLPESVPLDQLSIGQRNASSFEKEIKDGETVIGENIKIQPSRNNNNVVLIEVPKSRTNGGKFYTNQDILSLTGSFSEMGGQMVARLPKDNVSQFLRVIESMGIRLMNPTSTNGVFLNNLYAYTNTNMGEGFVPTKTEAQKTNTEKLADMARSGKINKPGQFMSSTGFTVVWDAMLEAIAVTIETTGSVGNAIKKATQVMKDSDWFKNLAPNIQDEQVAQMELYLDDQIKKQYHDKIVEKETKEFNTPKGSSKPITEPSGITYVEASEDPNGEQKERQFVANTVGAVDERTTLQVMEQMYNTTTNIFQLDQAKRYINSFDSIEAAENALIKGQSNLPIDVQVVAMMEIVRQYNAMGKYEQAASMIDELAPLSTSLAKALQAHNLWRVMIEDMNSVLAYAQRQQSKNKKKAFEKDGVGTKTSKRIKKVAKQVGKQTVESKRVKAKIDSVSGKLSERLEKRKRDKFLNILDSIIIDTKNKSFDATLGIPIAIYNYAIKTIKAGYVAGLTILEAIELGIEKLGEYKESHGDKLREDILEKFGEDVEDSAPKKDKEKTKSKKSIVKQSAEDLGIKITDIITKHYDVQEQAKQSLKETLINEAGLNEQEAKELSDMVEEEFRVAAEKRLKSLEKKHKGTNFNYKKLVEAINVGEATSSSVDKAVTALLGLDALTAEEVKGIEDLTKAAQAAPAGFQRQEAITDLMRHIYTLKGASTKDILWALWYSSILSGFTTLLKNGLGNLANISLEGTVNTIFHLFSGALNLDPKRMMQAFAWVGDVSKGMGRGFIEAADILKEGYEPLKSIKHAEGLPSTSQDVLETWDHLFKLNPTKLARYVKRIMVATDAVAYYGLKNMAAKEFERKIRREYGIDKLERDALLTALDSNLKEADIEAIEQVKEEGLTGIKAKRRYYELIDAYREKYLPGITDISVKFASRGTYNYEPQGTLGEMSKLIIKAHQNENMFISSASKVLFPFVRIVANVTNQNLDYTPLGIKRAIFSGNKYYETVEEKQKAIAKVALGMAVFGGLLAAALRALDDDDENPWFMVTSDGYGNTKENQLLYANGWSPYTTTLFGVKFDYRYTPLAMIFTVMGHLIDAKKYKGEVDKDTWDRTTLILMRTGTALFDMSYLSGINSAVKLFEQGPMQEKNIANFFARTITSPIPNALRSIELLYNKDLYDNSTIEAAILKNIPFVPGLRGPVRYNIFDEKIQVQGNFEKLIDKEETNELAKFLIKNHIKISGVSNKIANTKLTPEEYIELGRGIAKGLKLYLKENISWLKLETQEDIQNNINEEVERLKEEIKHDKFEKYYNAAVEGLE